MEGVSYILRNTNRSSSELGNCEVCGKHASEVYHLVQQRSYTEPDGTQGRTYHGCFSKWGHKECLVALT